MVKQRKIGIKSYSDFGGMITGIHFNAGSCQSNHSEKFYFPHYKYLHESTCCTSVLILIVQRLCQLERRFQPNDYYPCIHKKLRSGALWQMWRCALINSGSAIAPLMAHALIHPMLFLTAIRHMTLQSAYRPQSPQLKSYLAATWHD